MELCWQKLKDLFEFSARFDEEVTKDWAFFIMGNSSKYFRHYLKKNYVKKGIEPEWCKYPHQQEYWSDFVSWKESDEAKEQSEANIGCRIALAHVATCGKSKIGNRRRRS